MIPTPHVPHWWTSGDGPNESNKSCAHSAEGTCSSRCDRNAPWQGAFYTSVNAQCLCHHTVPWGLSRIWHSVGNIRLPFGAVLLKDLNFTLCVKAAMLGAECIRALPLPGFCVSVLCLRSETSALSHDWRLVFQTQSRYFQSFHIKLASYLCQIFELGTCYIPQQQVCLNREMVCHLSGGWRRIAAQLMASLISYKAIRRRTVWMDAGAGRSRHQSFDERDSRAGQFCWYKSYIIFMSVLLCF